MTVTAFLPGDSSRSSSLSVVRIAIAGNSKDYCWPCGSCRQVLFEFAPDLEVLIAKEGGDYVKLSLQALLAHGFGPKALL